MCTGAPSPALFSIVFGWCLNLQLPRVWSLAFIPRSYKNQVCSPVSIVVSIPQSPLGQFLFSLELGAFQALLPRVLEHLSKPELNF